MLRDVICDDLRLVICGTAAGAKSAASGYYYADDSNCFWQTLAVVGLTPRRLSPQEFTLLPTFGIGLTDIEKEEAGPDRVLKFTSTGVDEARRKIEKYRPRILCFNGKRAAQLFFGLRRVEYGVCKETLGDTTTFVAPSTSGMARAYWDVGRWWELAALVASV